VLAEFCLRLAFGSVVLLPLLPAPMMQPRFFRTQFLVALGLAVLAALFAPLHARWPALAVAGFALYGSVSWTLQRPPLGWSAVVLTSGAAAWTAVIAGDPSLTAWPLTTADVISSGLLLGAALTGMLVGHSYLISPGLTIRPLVSMLAALAAALAIRAAVLTFGWFSATADGRWGAATLLREYAYFLVPRWLIGLGGPAVFGAMAYQAARIRSTQSATGILFVVVICSFLGELLGLLVARTLGVPL